MIDYYQSPVFLETENLILRDLTEEDKAAVFININHDREVLNYYLDKYCEDISEFQFERVIDYCRQNRRYYLAIVLKQTGEVIGTMNQCNDLNRYFHGLEIGYAIGRPYWNKGYTTEALQAFTEYLFEKGIHKVFCGCISENKASARVMMKAGMQYEGTRKDEIFYHDRYWDVDYYCRIRG